MIKESDSPKNMDCDGRDGATKSFKIPMPEVIVDVPDALPADSQDENDDAEGLLHSDVKSDLLSVYSFQSSSGYASSMCSSVHNSTWNVFREKKCSSSDLTDGESDYKDLASPGLALSPGPVSPFSDSEGQRSPIPSSTCFVFDIKADHLLLSADDSQPSSSRGRSLSDSDCIFSANPQPQEEGQSHPYKKRLLRKYAEESNEKCAAFGPATAPRSSAFCVPVPMPTTTTEAPSAAATESRPQGLFLTQDFGIIRGRHYEVSFPPLYAGPVLSSPTLVDHFRFSAFSGFADSTLLNQDGLLSRSQNLAPSFLSLAPTQPLGSMNRRFASVPFSLQLSGCSIAMPANAHTPHQFMNPGQLLSGFPGASMDTSLTHRYRCRLCCQSFKSYSRLMKHASKSHRGQRSLTQVSAPAKVHECSICQKSFSRSDMLTRHMRLHTGVKPYSCRTCGQMFSRSDHLSTHKRTHTGEKPYQCPVCPYAASRRDLITRHVKTHGQDGGKKGSGRQMITAPIKSPSLASGLPLQGVASICSSSLSVCSVDEHPQSAHKYLTVPSFPTAPSRRHSTDAALVASSSVTDVDGSTSPSPNVISSLASSISEINVRSPRTD